MIYMQYTLHIPLYTQIGRYKIKKKCNIDKFESSGFCTLRIKGNFSAALVVYILVVLDSKTTNISNAFKIQIAFEGE